MQEKDLCKKCNTDVFRIRRNNVYCSKGHKQKKLVISVWKPSKKKIKDCKFCGCEKCQCNKTYRGIKITINEGELNALEDLGMVDLKSMYLMGRERELEKWQERCFNFWKRVVKKVDYGKK